MDAKYIKGMLIALDMQPNAAINRWIQGILLFNFNLIHVPGTKFKGPDALSQRDIGPDEEHPAPEYDDSWLDDMALLAYQPDLMVAQEINSFIYQTTQQDTIACSFANHIDWRQIQNETLKKIKELHMHKQEPTVTNP